MQRLKAYSVFAHTKDKRLLEFLKDPKSLLKTKIFKESPEQETILGNLSLEHFIYIINRLNDLQFLREIVQIIINSLEFCSRYTLKKNSGKVLMECGYKTDYSLEGRIDIVFQKVKEKLECHD